MTDKCETYILDMKGNWIREEDWYWHTAEDERLDEDRDLGGELSSAELMATAGPVARFYHAIKTPFTSEAPAPVERDSLLPLAEAYK